MRRLTLALCVLSSPVLANPALADDYLMFHSPSGNIHCAIFTGDYAGARCDIFALTPSFTKRPADCELDWGNAFAVDASSRKGYLACVGDTVADDGGLELGYGKSVSLGGFECSSQKSGMTCTNAAGHGFTIAKARQKVF